MNEIIRQLDMAQQENQLVNVYLTDGDIFYTGYIAKYNDQEVLISTYESSGLADGYVALRTAAIEEIETQSEDIDRIEEQMQMAMQDNLMEAKPAALNFDSDVNLFAQIIIEAYLKKDILLVQDMDSRLFYTGKVQSIKNETFDFLRINKFDASKNEVITLTFAQVKLMEFQGRELSVMSNVIENVNPANNVPHTAESINNIIDVLNRAFSTKEFVEVRGRYNDHFFYVGQVIMLNDSGIVLKVVDMAGQFGGYVFMKMNAIEKVRTGNDYLQLISLMRDDNVKEHRYCQPVLNDSREFDSTEDNFMAILNQSRQKRELIRLQLKNGTSFLGYVDNTKRPADGCINFNLLDETATFIIYHREFKLNDIVEIGFEYIYAYLDERRLKAKGDM